MVALGYLSVYYHADMNAVNKAFDMPGIAEGGIDCYLVEIPFHMAMFAADAPSWFIENYGSKNYNTWMVGGHSMGGIVASQYASKHSDVIDGIVLLASYSTAEIPEIIALLTFALFAL